MCCVETVCAVVRKSYSGRRLTFHDAKLECDLRELFANDVEDALPQLLVRTVAVQNSDNAANSDLPYAKQIAVNKTYTFSLSKQTQNANLGSCVTH